ncbi:MAG: RagB/SusD family nutrient uptake outer membrane protein [Tannerellaceae bacterium]|nr:RagB/SusD family nutrient uptake outer membrane protein [Tannerellaceae bacterium]
MRKIIYLSIITCLLTILSCSDFLELNPNDQLFRENFWQTEKDAQLALTGVYNQLRNAPSYNHGRILWDGLSDAAYSRLYNTIARGVIESTTGSIVSGIYSESYVLIGRCNNFLANIDRVEIDVDEKNKYKGEVLFLRALAYFTLTEFYGGVPLYTAPVTMEEAKVKQSAKEQVIQQVLTDLDQAISYLPDTAYRGHAVKGSALALKAQVLMHNEQWPEAAKTATLIIEKGIFRLSDNYPDLFLSEGQINNPEILFSVRFLNPDAPCNTSIDQNPDLIAAHDLTIEPIQEYIDIFECIDGLPWNESPPLQSGGYV